MGKWINILEKSNQVKYFYNKNVKKLKINELKMILKDRETSYAYILWDKYYEICILPKAAIRFNAVAITLPI